MHVIPLTPEEVSDRFGLYVERSFEKGLEYFHFVGFKRGECFFGLRRYLDSPVQTNSMVSVIGVPDNQKRRLIAEVFDLKVSDVFQLNIPH